MRLSNYYFLTIAPADREDIAQLTASLKRRSIRVVSSGQGTARFPFALWFETATRYADVPAIREALEFAGLNARTLEVIPIGKGEGKTQARQLSFLVTP